MIKVTFSYSTDPVTTWTSAVYIAEDYKIDVIQEMVVEQRFQEEHRIRRIYKGRVKVLLRIPLTEFDETNDPTHARYVWLQDWLRKPTLRIYTHDGTSGLSIDGRSYFDNASNQNYVVPEEEIEPENVQEDIKFFDLHLEMAKVVD